jgi:hypothetical protein
LKKVLSISLGSSSRNHTAEAEFLGEQFWLSRQGVDGDYDRYVRMFAENDGKVDAFGIGGTEFFLWVNERKYYFREIKRVRKVIRISKVGDGNGIKHLLEPLAMDALREHGVELRGKKALKTTGVDRYGLAKSLVDAGCDVTFGDLMFALDLPIPIHSLRTLHLVAALLLPIMTQLPMKWLYPIGEKQDAAPSTRFASFVSQFDIIAGDFLQVWKNLPADLSGKIIVTNTTTEKNVDELQKRGLHILVTNTPRLGGRSFGTNVMEAMCRCLVDKPDDQITQDDFLDLIRRIPLKPQVHVLNC